MIPTHTRSVATRKHWTKNFNWIQQGKFVKEERVLSLAYENTLLNRKGGTFCSSCRVQLGQEDQKLAVILR